MTSPATSFQRARRPEQKEQRQRDILDAARRLAARDGVRNVTLTDIAAEVGVHKSALLRYFETREQIFLDLTAASWLEWVGGLHADLDAAGGAPTTDAPEVVAAVLARSFALRPVLCDLIAHTALNLERHVSVEAVRAYKLTSLAVMVQAAGLVQRALPYLTTDESADLVRTMANLAGSLWQIANPPAALAALYASDPRLAWACGELAPRLQRIASVLIAGLVPSRPVAPAGGG